MQSANSTFTSLEEIIQSISHLLPTQGPIDVFIHHNTLHAFEHLKFEDAVEEASKIYGAQVFHSEQKYIEDHNSGRITESDSELVIKQEDSDNQTLWGISKLEFIKKFLLVSPSVENFQQVKWLLRENPELTLSPNCSTESLIKWANNHRGKTNNLFSLNYEAAQGLSELIDKLPVDDKIKLSERFVLWAATLIAVARNWKPIENKSEVSNITADEQMINPIIIRFAEEYLDLGFSDQLLPGRNAGMLHAFLNLVEKAHYAVPKWLQPIIFELALYRKQPDPIILLKELLSDFRITETDQYQFLLQEALSLKGWAGYVALAEKHPEILHQQENEIKPRLAEFLVIRLILKKYAQRSIEYQSKLPELQKASTELNELDHIYCFAYHLLHVVTNFGEAQEFITDIESAQTIIRWAHEFPENRRRRIWHLAYENNFYNRSLNALIHHNRVPACHPIAQFVFCIDDREESIRRHVEDRNNAYQTFGTAGFFGVDANYTQLSGTSSPHCPIIIKPTHAIREVPKEGVEDRLSRYQKKQQAWFRISGFVNRSSGSYIQSVLLSLIGCLSFIPMVLGVIAPRGMQYITKFLGGEGTIPADLAELKLDADSNGDAELPGYTLDEMADRVAAVLKGIGLISSFSDLIFLIGHGSSSKNNPLRSAYECGACGGRPGRMNPRAFALMANQGSVRSLVAAKHQIIIPDQSYFIGGFHNTCSDIIEYFDLDKCPTRHLSLLSQIKIDLNKATKQNALERCRRFVQARIKNTTQAAHEALARSLMLSEARPEYNHATNAMCIIGPRDLTTGLFLDRRSFLVSYDTSIDHDSNILLGILRAVVPVCGGINLEYLFSTIDNEIYGAGTKLPHNIVSLIGLMNGTSSDLRTGLPAQMVEIHEAVRLLVIVAASEEQLNKVMQIDSNIKGAFDRNWLKLARWDVTENKIYWRLGEGSYQAFRPSNDQIDQVDKYKDWFMGKSNHLNFVELTNQRNI
jgi:uncharacterized protein